MNAIVGLELKNTNAASKRFIVVLILGVLEQIMQINGLIQVYPNIAKICNNLCLYIVAIQLVGSLVNKYINNDNKRRKYFMKVLTDFYLETEKNDEYSEILKSFVKYSKVFMQRSVRVYIAAFFTICISGILISLVYNEKIYVILLYLPFIDPYSLLGYIINTILLYIFAITFGIGIVASIQSQIFFITQAIPMTKVICKKIESLGKKLSSKGKIKEKEVNAMLINIIEDHYRYCNLIQDIQQHASIESFAILSFNTIGLGMSVIVARYMSFLTGVLYFLCLAYQCSINCVLGSIIDHQNEKICNELIEFPWFELSRKNKKIFLQFIHCCQNVDFEIVIVGKVNMELFSYLMNASYSYLMFVLNFMDN